MMTRDQIIALLETSKAEIRSKFKAEIKGIFGSYARDQAGKDSDIDILVEFLKGATLLDLTGLGHFLEDRLGCKVDLVSQRAIRGEIKPYIEKELIYL